MSHNPEALDGPMAAEGVAGRTPDPALAAPLYRDSEGNSLFIVEMAVAPLCRWLAAWPLLVLSLGQGSVDQA